MKIDHILIKYLQKQYKMTRLIVVFHKLETIKHHNLFINKLVIKYSIKLHTANTHQVSLS